MIFISKGSSPYLKVYKNQQVRDAKTNTDKTPSLDNQLERHWLKALQARSGCPRWSVELSSPEPIKQNVNPAVIIS